MQKKKKVQKKQKKAKGEKDEVDLLLDAFIVENKSWPNQLAKAYKTIRRLTTQSEAKYFEGIENGSQQEWPTEESVNKALGPEDFRLKNLKFLSASQRCQDQYGCSAIRAGV